MAMIDELRAKFEEWLHNIEEFAYKHLTMHDGEYTTTSTYIRWEAYQAAYASRDAEVEALRKRINDAPVYYVPTKKPDSEDGWLQVIGSVKALNDMRGKHVRLVIDATMRPE